MRSGIRDLFATMCTVLCSLAALSSYTAFAKADMRLYCCAIVYIILGAAFGVFALK